MSLNQSFISDFSKLRNGRVTRGKGTRKGSAAKEAKIAAQERDRELERDRIAALEKDRELERDRIPT